MNIIIIIFNITSCIWNWSHTNHLHERDQTQQCGNLRQSFNQIQSHSNVPMVGHGWLASQPDPVNWVPLYQKRIWRQLWGDFLRLRFSWYEDLEVELALWISCELPTATASYLPTAIVTRMLMGPGLTTPCTSENLLVTDTACRARTALLSSPSLFFQRDSLILLPSKANSSFPSFTVASYSGKPMLCCVGACHVNCTHPREPWRAYRLDCQQQLLWDGNYFGKYYLILFFVYHSPSG